VIIGDPFKFAIIIEVLKMWNPTDYNGFANGVLLFCVDGELFPNFVVNATLGYELQGHVFMDKLASPAVNNELYHMEAEKAFFEMHYITRPHYTSDIEENDCYNITPQILSDNRCQVFAVSNGEQVRILASRLNNYLFRESRYDLRKLDISEIFLPINELNEIVSELKIFIQTVFD